ncbi:MAG: aminodeoxychorismate lyase [Chromatiaceae bacterium]|nr:aminodeoxychorismate lyase [Chromatiaceae bacterium]
MTLRSLINGVEQDRLPIADRGLQYGDGLFETIGVRDGQPCLWREHFDRLSRGADRLGIPCPRQEQLLGECVRLIRGESICVLKLILTRGSGGRGYRAPENPRPTCIVSLHPWPKYPITWGEEGVTVTFCRTPLGENPALAGLKHLNRLEQVLARSEWRNPEIAEGLMQDGRGRIIGGTMSNLFLVRAGRLLTPRLDTCGIAGTARALVLRIAGLFGIEVVERDIARTDVLTADGLFLTNALIGVWPVRRLVGQDVGLTDMPSKLIAAVQRAARTPDGRSRG